MGCKILIDTNVLLDYFLTREPFYQDAREIIRVCMDDKVQGCIAAHSVLNMFFILRKDYSVQERRELLINLCTIFDVESIDKTNLLAGLENENFSDFEDCLQMKCAEAYGAEYIVTRNVKDFSASEIQAITPKEFLQK
jgi:predicted nucleic acid-binding protein